MKLLFSGDRVNYSCGDREDQLESLGHMEVEFADERLKRLYVDRGFTGGFPPAIVKAFRKMIQAILAAVDERDLYARPGFRFEKLTGSRSHERSLRLNDQYRLIVEVSGTASSKTIRVISVEDYH